MPSSSSLPSVEDLLALSPGKDLAQGHILLIDKPLAWTSFNVVGKVRYLLRHRLGYGKIKVGHAGTLDPLATGLVVVCIGKATKLAGELTNEDKRYTATFTLGARTASHDLETPVEAGGSIEELLRKTCGAPCWAWRERSCRCPRFFPQRGSMGSAPTR